MDKTAAAHAAYYPRHARSCLQRADNAHDPAIRGRLVVMANEFAGKAGAYEEETFIISALKSGWEAIPAQ
jgi:hypothetical protein